MKELINEYKKIFCNFLKEKRYLVSVILVAILSYGFTITHYSIGIDDLCLDRYVNGTYMLAENRWGTWLLYNVLHITKFSPFWLDFIVATLMVIATTLICTAMKKILKDKASIWAYVIFSSIFLSNPIIGQFFIYQSTNLTVVVSNIIAIISAILLVENAFSLKSKWTYIIVGIILIFAFSMYEACAQSFLAMLFVLLLLRVIIDKFETKKMLNIIIEGIMSLAIGIVGYYIIGKFVGMILQQMQIGVKDFAEHNIIWLNKNFWNMSLESKIQWIKIFLINPLGKNIKEYLPVTIITVTSLLAIMMGIIDTVKEKKNIIVPLLGVIFSSWALIGIKGLIMYRIQFSWTITVAFVCMYLFIRINKKKLYQYIVGIFLIWLIIIQTNNLNDFFYNEYRRYEKEKMAAYEIARDIKKCDDYKNKQIVYRTSEIIYNPFDNCIDNQTLVLQWGKYAFDEFGTETTKFINYLGYNFPYNEEAEKNNKFKEEFYDKYGELIKEKENDEIIEVDNYIIVNITSYLSE